MTAEVVQMAIGLLTMLGGLFVFVSRADRASMVEKLDNLIEREAEHHADIVKRMDLADERSSRYASMVQTVPLLEQRVSALERWRESGR
jgi:Zn-dependent protease with chaperone function